MNILVFIPCYNCEKQILKTITGLHLFLKNSKIYNVSKIWIVDNKSGDRTSEMVKDFIIQSGSDSLFELIQNEKNIGLGGSFKKVFTEVLDSEYTHLLLIHGDNQANSKDINKFIQAFKENPHLSAVLGSRFMKSSSLHNYSKIREFSNRFLNFLLSILSGKNIFDLGSGINLYRIDSFNKKLISDLPDHIAFDLFLLFKMMDSNLQFKFVPIEWKSIDEKSTINHWSVGWLILTEIIKWKLKSFFRWPA